AATGFIDGPITAIGWNHSTAPGLAGSGPPMTAEKVHADIEIALADMAKRGWQAESCLINPDETAVTTVERRLHEGRYECLVIGAGLRLPPNRLLILEAVINAVHRAAPDTAIVFNTRPEDRGAAAARWLQAGAKTALRFITPF